MLTMKENIHISLYKRNQINIIVLSEAEKESIRTSIGENYV